MDELIRLLDEIAEVDAQVDLLHSDVAVKLGEIIPDEVAMEMDALHAEFAGPIEAGEKKVAALKRQAQMLATQHGGTVRGRHRMAVVSRKPSWNDEVLCTFLSDLVQRGVLTQDQLSLIMQLRVVKVSAQIREVR